VNIVVVLNVSSVTLIYFAEEGGKFISIDHRFNSQLFDNSEGNFLH